VGFSSPDHKVLKVSFCDGPWSVVHRPSVYACVRPWFNNTFKQILFLNRSLDFDQTSQERSLGDPIPKLFKPLQLIASVGKGIKNSKGNFHKSSCLKQQASSRGPLPKLFKLWSQISFRPGGQNFTLNFIRKTSNFDLLSRTADGSLAKLNRYDPRVIPYQSCWNGSDWMRK